MNQLNFEHGGIPPAGNYDTAPHYAGKSTGLITEVHAPGPQPEYPRSSLIVSADFARARYHTGSGDMWPITWSSDGNLYAGAGDNRMSPMNVWRISGEPNPDSANNASHRGDWILDVACELPVDPAVYAVHPRVAPDFGLKPAGLIELNGRLIMAVEAQNYGEFADFNRQTNIHGWLVASDDSGATWEPVTANDFFVGRVASCHFIQFGQGDSNVIDGYIYANFPGATDDGNSHWCNGDYILLGRVKAEDIVDRSAWEFWTGEDESGAAIWAPDDAEAQPIFRFENMTGEDHISFIPGLNRFLLGNFSFLDPDGLPRPYHHLAWPEGIDRSQLTLFEAPNPWGPWSLFHVDENWGTYGDYQPVVPVKWVYNEGRTLFLVSSGSYDDYNWVVQRLDLQLSDADHSNSPWAL